MLVRAKPKASHFISGKLVACDTETTGLLPYHGDHPFAFSFTNEEGESAYFEFPVDPFTRDVDYQFDGGVAFSQLERFFRDRSVTTIWHNAAFDVRHLEAIGIKVRGPLHDTMFSSHVHNTLEPNYQLKPLAKRYLDFSDEDQAALKKVVVKCRRVARKRGWDVAEDVEPDYWMPRALEAALEEEGEEEPEWLAEGLRRCEEYAVGDTERTMLLHLQHMEAFEEEDPRLLATYERERELWQTTYDMVKRGVRIDMAVIDSELVVWRGRRDNALKELRRVAGESFEPTKDADVRCLVYEILELPVKHRTPKKGLPAANVDALKAHIGNPTVATLFKWRAASKALSTFFEKFKWLAVKDTLRGGSDVINPSFQQMGPATGRFSCRTPNLQNVANALTTRSSEPIQARRPFKPRVGYNWYCIDYSQVEVRIFADVAQEKVMLNAIDTGEDLHTACTNKAWGGIDNPAAVRAAIHTLELDLSGAGDTEKVQALWKSWGINRKKIKRMTALDREKIAAEWLKEFKWDIVVAEKSVDKKTCRARAKMVLFAKLFGGGPNAMKDLLECTRDEAAGFLREYDYAFPGIVQYIRWLSAQAKADGHIWNCFGRRIIVNPDKAYRSVNYMVQGSAADLLKIAMMRCNEWLKQMGLDAHLVLTIHDELVFEVRKEHAYKWLLRGLCRIMEDHGGAFGVDTPVEVEKVGDNWSIKIRVYV